MIKLMQKFYKWLRPDGLLHLVVSTLLVMLLLPLLPPCRWWIAAAAVIVIGLAKEFYDATDPEHSAEWHDVACDLIGIAVGVGLFFYTIGLNGVLW